MSIRPALIAATLTVAALALGVVNAAATQADDWYDQDAGRALALSDAVAASLADLPADSASGPFGMDPIHPRFRGEWRFGTLSMAAAGHAQVGLSHPEHRDLMAARTSDAIDALIADASWTFDQAAWGDLALDHLTNDTVGGQSHDHAVLGYLGVALGLERLLDPDNRHAGLHDKLAAAQGRRMRHGPILETYPGEAYPVNHAANIATVALHAQATGQPPPTWLQPHIDRWQVRFIDDRGLVYQVVSPTTGAPRSVARGSGTALSAWFIGFADPTLSAALATAIQDQLGTRVFGIDAVREYPAALCAGGHSCAADIDSGPIIMGAGVSATGFSLAAARRLGDRAWFDGLWQTTALFGQPLPGGGFATGGTLGNAIMLAMLTAPISSQSNDMPVLLK